MHQAQPPTSQAGALCKAIRCILGGYAKPRSSPGSTQAACRWPLGFQKGQGPSSHLAEVVVHSFEAISRQTRAASTGEVPSTAGLRCRVALPGANDMHLQGPPLRRQGDALCGTALTVSRDSTVAVSAPRALPGTPLPAGCSTAKPTKQGALACEA